MISVCSIESLDVDDDDAHRNLDGVAHLAHFELKDRLLEGFEKLSMPEKAEVAPSLGQMVCK